MKRFIEMGFFHHPLLVTTEGKNFKMQRMPLKDSISSEPIGCLLTAGNAAQISSTYWPVDTEQTASGRNNNTGTSSAAGVVDTSGGVTGNTNTDASSSNGLPVEISNSTTSSGPFTDQEAYGLTMMMIKKLAEDSRRRARSAVGKVNNSETTSDDVNHELSKANHNHQVELLVSTYTDAVVRQDIKDSRD